MVHTCYLVRHGVRVLGVIYRRNAEECASLLCLDLCALGDCPLRREGTAHAHVPEPIVSIRQLPEIGPIMWGRSRADKVHGVVIYFEPQKLIL